MAEQAPRNLIISGATGWLGQEVLALLETEKSQASAFEVIAISSKKRILEHPTGHNMVTHTYDEIDSIGQVDGFVNLAFLTREKVLEVGYQQFVLRNLDLISQASQVIERSKPQWVVLVSSGAIFKKSTDQLETSISENPYGFLKWIEELLLTDAAARVGAKIVIGRLWGATGRYMPINRAYALSDFVCQADVGGPIKVRSGHQVFRRYCDAGDFMNVLIRLAESGRSSTLNSGGPLIEIGDLAHEVARHFKDVVIDRAPVDSTSIDDYYPRSNDFEDMAHQMNVALTSISAQIERTVMGYHDRIHKTLLVDPTPTNGSST